MQCYNCAPSSQCWSRRKSNFKINITSRQLVLMTLSVFWANAESCVFAAANSSHASGEVDT
jgi:hypothetical protein